MALRDLIGSGQSYWLDDLSRRAIRSGELRSRVETEGLRGVTSNPKIFKKAITGDDDYESAIAELLPRCRQAQDIYEALVIDDVRNACDILGSVYDETQGQDGFVSLEVSPHLVYDARGTIEEAVRLHNTVDRANLMIKIPGSDEGMKAIEEALYKGINVNITLLFSIESYTEVAKSYMRALERRSAEGKTIDNIASVASFFLSRIDVLVDQLLAHRVTSEADKTEGPRASTLFGKAAVANAKIAYQRFKELISTPEWKKLARRGGRVQRVLWASTSTKNPDYPDTMYVEPLIGPDTVTTMPKSTAAAFDEHGCIVENAIEDGVDEAFAILDHLERIGVDMKHVTWQLLNEGVQKFIDPFDSLIGELEDRRRTLGATGAHQRW